MPWRRGPETLFLCSTLSLALLFGCTKVTKVPVPDVKVAEVTEAEETQGTDTSVSPGADTTEGPAEDTTSSGAVDTTPTPEDGETAAPLPATPSPLRQLSPAEYAFATRDLFPNVTPEHTYFPPPVRVFGFENAAEAQYPSAILTEKYRLAAVRISDEAFWTLPAIQACAEGPDGQMMACGEAYVLDLAHRAFRRPLSPSETSALQGLYSSVYTGQGYQVAIQLATQAILQMPQFLYRMEFGQGEPDDQGRIALSGYEIASRLSFLLWHSIPDAELLEAAADGALSTTSKEKSVPSTESRAHARSGLDASTLDVVASVPNWVVMALS